MPDKRKTPVVDYKLCMACRVCVSACPFSCLDVVKADVDKWGKVYPVLVKPESCTGCGICAKACPVDAVRMAD